MKNDSDKLKVGDLVKAYVKNKGLLKGEIIFSQMEMYLVKLEDFEEPEMFGGLELTLDLERIREEKLSDLLE